MDCSVDSKEYLRGMMFYVLSSVFVKLSKVELLKLCDDGVTMKVSRDVSVCYVFMHLVLGEKCAKRLSSSASCTRLFQQLKHTPVALLDLTS